MASIGERIRKLREDNNLTQEELGRILNVKKAAVSKYETDKVSMNLDSIKILAKYFHAPISYFTEDTGSTYDHATQIPILGYIHADSSILAEENIEDYMKVPDTLSADFALQVKGDSMRGAGILEGDFAICKLSAQPKHGQIIAARKNLSSGYSEALLSYYLDTEDQPILKPANPHYPSINYCTGGYTSAGYLVAIYRTYVPGYEVYRDFQNADDCTTEWDEVMETAAEYGLSAQDILSSINIQAKILRRLRGI